MKLLQFYTDVPELRQSLSLEDFETLLQGVVQLGNLQQRKVYEQDSPARRARAHLIWNEDSVYKNVKNNYSDFSQKAIVFFSMPLLLSSLKKIVNKTFIKDKTELYPSVFTAGVTGMRNGLHRYDHSSGAGTSLHYIIRWFNTYARRELEKTEADLLGVTPSRLVILKRIAAIRLKATEAYGRALKDSEIFDFIQAGKAETLKSKTGDIGKVNKSITVEDIAEQSSVYAAYFFDNDTIAHT